MSYTLLPHIISLSAHRRHAMPPRRRQKKRKVPESDSDDDVAIIYPPMKKTKLFDEEKTEETQQEKTQEKTQEEKTEEEETQEEKTQEKTEEKTQDKYDEEEDNHEETQEKTDEENTDEEKTSEATGEATSEATDSIPEQYQLIIQGVIFDIRDPHLQAKINKIQKKEKDPPPTPHHEGGYITFKKRPHLRYARDDTNQRNPMFKITFKDGHEQWVARKSVKSERRIINVMRAEADDAFALIHDDIVERCHGEQEPIWRFMCHLRSLASKCAGDNCIYEPRK